MLQSSLVVGVDAGSLGLVALVVAVLFLGGLLVESPLLGLVGGSGVVLVVTAYLQGGLLTVGDVAAVSLLLAVTAYALYSHHLVI